MTIKANIILDSISEDGIRITTMQLRYHRFIHAEVLVHRSFSRSASSSRAIPVKKIIQDVLDDPAMPIHWGKNQPGMQAFEEQDVPLFLPADSPCACTKGPYTREQAWLRARDKAVEVARAFDEAGYHKQLSNRLLEPFMHMNVCVTSTQWSNFYALRRHSDAQPEIKALADAMFEAQEASTPTLLKMGEWHLPYIREDDWVASRQAVADGMRATPNPYVIDPVIGLLIQTSVARCARTSYKLHDGSDTTFEADVKLYDKLLSSIPLHSSPAEHVATPDRRYDGSYWNNANLHGNFSGWIQFRKTLAGECQ